MRNLPPATTDVLYGANVHMVAELYTFHFSTGIQRWTSADTDVTSGSLAWSCNGPLLITRGSLKASAGLEVDDLELTLVGGSTFLGNTPIPLAAIRGDLDGIRVQLQRAYFSGSWGNVAGDLITVFDGYIGEVEPGSAEVKLTVKSAVDRMSRPLPFRIVQPQCPYAFCDLGCGLSLSNYTVATTVSPMLPSTVSEVMVAYTAVDTDHFKLGVLNITSGPLAGTTRSIVSSRHATGGTHAVTVEPALPSIPDVGASVTVSVGCDKAIGTCRTKFNNVARYGGFPSMPMNSTK